MGRWTIALALVGGSTAACNAILGNQNGSYLGAGDGAAADVAASGTDSGSTPDSPSDAPPQPDAPIENVDGGAGGTCPDAGRGPTMVNIDGMFCIDSTEVTVGQYNAFQNAAGAPGSHHEPAACAFNTMYAPNGPTSQTVDDNPVAYVDWCDAFAFCDWAGKRLCGAVDGGPATEANYGLPSNEHFYACSNGGRNVWPYGNDYEPKECNDGDGGIGMVWSVTTGTCAGAFPGLYDMVGNLQEWQNGCEGDAGSGDFCIHGTGSFETTDKPTCNTFDHDQRGTPDQGIGFRCCASLD
jgi:formylglycine-generating enzyme required for sulfatase activity